MEIAAATSRLQREEENQKYAKNARAGIVSTLAVGSVCVRVA
jgi:hypothetical protein